MRNIALKLMYVGTAYHGWQVQKNAVTVCETLQKALEKITGAPVHLTGCGRTDAGVHAERYIANFRTESRIPLERLPFAINTHTPEDIAVSEALEVAEDFNAIGSCLKKEYTYRIYNSRVKNPFYVNRAYFYPKRLDEEFLNRAAHQFVGTHDFAAVRSVGTETRTTVRTIYWCDVTRSGELLELKVCADGFLYNMVRAITGTVLYAAEGKLTPEEIASVELATGAPESLQQETAEGLTLESTLGTDSPEERMVEHIALREAIDQLPEREKMTILLRFFKGLTQEQTARILGVSQVQISRLERRGLADLRRLLDG